MNLEKDRKKFRLIGLYIDLGFRFGIIFLIGFFAGWWLDNKFDKVPLFTMIGLFFGMGSGFYHLYKSAMHLEKKEKNNLNEE